MSRFLDIAIDAGAVVPITEISEGIVKRTFRHGEDIVFTESEIRLFGMMLQSVAKSRGTDVLDRIVVEKLSVLFLKAGLEQAIFEPWTGKMGKAKALGVQISPQRSGAPKEHGESLRGKPGTGYRRHPH